MPPRSPVTSFNDRAICRRTHVDDIRAFPDPTTPETRQAGARLGGTSGGIPMSRTCGVNHSQALTIPTFKTRGARCGRFKRDKSLTFNPEKSPSFHRLLDAQQVMMPSCFSGTHSDIRGPLACRTPTPLRKGGALAKLPATATWGIPCVPQGEYLSCRGPMLPPGSPDRVTSSWREERAVTALRHRRECGWASEQDLEELKDLEETLFDNSHPASPCGYTHGGKQRPRPGYSCKLSFNESWQVQKFSVQPNCKQSFFHPRHAWDV